MRIVKALFKRKKGGTRVGNWIRRTISGQTYGLSDFLGLTDGHLVDGDESNGEADYD